MHVGVSELRPRYTALRLVKHIYDLLCSVSGPVSICIPSGRSHLQEKVCDARYLTYRRTDMCNAFGDEGKRAAVHVHRSY